MVGKRIKQNKKHFMLILYLKANIKSMSYIEIFLYCLLFLYYTAYMKEPKKSSAQLLNDYINSGGEKATYEDVKEAVEREKREALLKKIKSFFLFWRKNESTETN
jgi:hypothetical protein